MQGEPWEAGDWLLLPEETPSSGFLGAPRTVPHRVIQLQTGEDEWAPVPRGTLQGPSGSVLPGPLLSYFLQDTKTCDRDWGPWTKEVLMGLKRNEKF